MDVRIISNFDQVMLRLASGMRNVDENVRKIMHRNAGKYRQQAKQITRTIVYGKPANPKYPRSFDTWRSVDAMPTQDGVIIFNNPELAVMNKRFPGLQSYANRYGTLTDSRYTYYPRFVMEGNFFGHKQAPRDYLSVWKVQIKDSIIQDLNQAKIFTYS
jgi:hypothetical protein